MANTRPINSTKYQSYHDATRGMAAAILQVAVYDCFTFGLKRFKHRSKMGHDWISEHKKKGKDYVNSNYRELRNLVGWIYSYQFGLICDKLGLDLDLVQDELLRLMAGPDDGTLYWH